MDPIIRQPFYDKCTKLCAQLLEMIHCFLNPSANGGSWENGEWFIIHNRVKYGGNHHV